MDKITANRDAWQAARRLNELWSRIHDMTLCDLRVCQAEKIHLQFSTTVLSHPELHPLVSEESKAVEEI